MEEFSQSLGVSTPEKPFQTETSRIAQAGLTQTLALTQISGIAGGWLEDMRV